MTSFRYALVSLIVSILAFLPWMQFFLTEASDLSEHFWLPGYPSLFECIKWFFGYNFIWVLFYFVLFIIVLYILFRFGVLKKRDNWAGRLVSFFDLEEHKWAAIIIGTVSVFMVIIGMTIMSGINTPVLSCRYIYPFSVVIWAVFAIAVVGCRARKTAVVFVMAIILLPGIPHCCMLMMEEYDENETIRATLDATFPLMNDGDILFSDEHMFAGNECLYYYGKDCDLCYDRNVMVDRLTDGHQNWLFLRSIMGDDMKDKILNRGFDCRLIKEDGRLGSDVLQIYLVTA